MESTLDETIGLRNVSNGRIISGTRRSTNANAVRKPADVTSARSTWPLVHA